MAFVAVLLTVGALWFTNRAVTPKQATWDDVLAEGKNGGYEIITTEALSERYQKEAKQSSSGGHPSGVGVPDRAPQGAVNFPMEPTWWSRWRKASALETFLGPDKDRTVIFY